MKFVSAFKWLPVILVIAVMITSIGCGKKDTSGGQTPAPTQSLIPALTATLLPTSTPPSQGDRIKWQFETDQYYTTTCDPAIGPDGTIYVTAGTTAGGFARLYAVTPNGAKQWDFEVGSFWIGNPVVGADGTIYVVSGTFVYAVNPDGTQKWAWSNPYAGICDLALGADGTLYTSHCGNGVYYRRMFAINANGQLRWSNENAMSPDQWSGPTSLKGLTIGGDGVLYVSGSGSGVPDSPLYAVDANSGSILWKTGLGDCVVMGGMAIGSDGTIYAPLSMKKLVALNPDGTIRWEYTFQGQPGIPSIGTDGTIYVIAAGQTESGLYALTSSGTLKWRAGGAPAAHSVAIASAGTIYFSGWNPSPQGGFTAVGADGTIQWTLDIPIGRGSPAIGSDGTIYVAGAGSDHGVLTAVYGSGTLASSPWPRGRHDNNNTGRYGEISTSGYTHTPSYTATPTTTPTTGTLREKYNTGDDSAGDVRWYYWHAQTFTAESSHSVCSVKLKVYRLGSPGDLTVSLRAIDTAGHPTGPDLAVGTIDGNALTTNDGGEWREINFTASYTVIAGTKYAIVVRAPAGGGGKVVKWFHDEAGTYAGGNRETSADSGSTWGSDLITDYMFEVYSCE